MQQLTPRHYVVRTAWVYEPDPYTLSNGALLNAAEDAAFDLLLTTDRRIRCNRNMKTTRRLTAII